MPIQTHKPTIKVYILMRFVRGMGAFLEAGLIKNSLIWIN